MADKPMPWANGQPGATPAAPKQRQENGSLVWKVLVFVLFALLVLMGFMMIGGIDAFRTISTEKWRLELKNVGLQETQNFLEFKIGILEIKYDELKEQHDVLKEEYTRLANRYERALQEEVSYRSEHSTSVGFRQEEEGYTWTGHVKPTLVGVGVALLTNWLTGGLSLTGQVLVGVGGTVGSQVVKALM